MPECSEFNFRFLKLAENFFPNIFDPQLVESTDAEAGDTEGRLYNEIMIPECNVVSLLWQLMKGFLTVKNLSHHRMHYSSLSEIVLVRNAVLRKEHCAG